MMELHKYTYYVYIPKLAEDEFRNWLRAKGIEFKRWQDIDMYQAIYYECQCTTNDILDIREYCERCNIPALTSQPEVQT